MIHFFPTKEVVLGEFEKFEKVVLTSYSDFPFGDPGLQFLTPLVDGSLSTANYLDWLVQMFLDGPITSFTVGGGPVSDSYTRDPNFLSTQLGTSFPFTGAEQLSLATLNPLLYLADGTVNGTTQSSMTGILTSSPAIINFAGSARAALCPQAAEMFTAREAAALGVGLGNSAVVKNWAELHSKFVERVRSSPPGTVFNASRKLSKGEKLTGHPESRPALSKEPPPTKRTANELREDGHPGGSVPPTTKSVLREGVEKISKSIKAFEGGVLLPAVAKVRDHASAAIGWIKSWWAEAPPKTPQEVPKKPVQPPPPPSSQAAATYKQLIDRQQHRGAGSETEKQKNHLR